MKLNRKSFPKIKYINVFNNVFFYHLNGLRLKAVHNKHTHQSFGIKFIFHNKSLLYSSDTTLCKNILKEAKGCDYLIHDCTASSSFFKKHPPLKKMHTDSLSLTQAFLNSSIAKIIPIHFLLLDKWQEKKIRKELDPLKRKLLIPNDFQTIIV
jgi:ribonuclease BN (tRNA processing enzyme)